MPENISNKIYWWNGDCIPMWPVIASLYPTETKMKLALIGVAAVAAAAIATPALAQPVFQDPGYCAQFYPNANCQNLGWGNPYTGGYWWNSNGMMPGYVWSAEPDDYRYHGGPKYND